jgi:radical SAM superfamily enzyme YgiQ (UPF0313 family)
MAKLVLVNSGTQYEFGTHEPLHLLCLAAYVHEAGHKVAIADEIAGEDVIAKIDKLKPDFVGREGSTPVIQRAYKVADWCRSKGIKVILGGVHVTTMTDEALKHGDYVVKGEGEDALVKILNGEAEPGIVTGKVVYKLDELPRINRDLVSMKYYQKGKDRTPGNHLHFVPPNKKLSSIFATRGCSFDCIFCHNNWRGLPVRINSAKRIIEEMKELEDKYGTEYVFFMDDDLLFLKPRMREFCELYKKEGLKILWGCQSKVTTFSDGDIDKNREYLRLLKEAGCRQVTFGFEAGSDRVLAMLKNERATLEQGRLAARLVKESGILSCGSFMIGNPGETEEEIQVTKKFILENDLDGFGVSITTPFPGTKLWEMCEEKGVIPKEIDWEKFSLNDLTWELSDIPMERMREIHKEFLNLVMQRNPGMAPRNVIRVAMQHPVKAMRRAFRNPKDLMVIMDRMINKNQVEVQVNTPVNKSE